MIRLRQLPAPPRVPAILSHARSRRLKTADRLIVALDFTALTPAVALAKRLVGLVRTIKVGSALFTACGPTGLQRLRALGFEVMLDLKFFDIPSTVELSCRAAVRHHVSMLTVHASGASAMLKAAVQGVRAEAEHLRLPRPLVFGVTVLTSEGNATSQTMAASVLRLARSALEAGCDGVVASAQEAPFLRQRFGSRLQVVCPGIRPAAASTGSDAHPSLRAGGAAGRSSLARLEDQRRIATPRNALASGADWIVVGRPITAAPNPRAATMQILHEMEDASPC